MTRVLVTGATGFLGNHVVRELLNRNVDVIATGRDTDKARQCDWFARVDFQPLDLANLPECPFETLGSPDRVIHLAWSGLPNYRDEHHLTTNLPQSRLFAERMFAGGLQHLLVAGTCFEYGMQEGELNETMSTEPDNPYGRAKDLLRKELEAAFSGTNLIFQWARLFYMYGPGQGDRSLFAQLQRAIDNGDISFDMSGGEQIRDFLPVETVAAHLVDIALQDSVTGVVNVCSGRRVTVRELVEEYLAERDAVIALNLGIYPYPDWEPFRFWGSTKKLAHVNSARTS